MKDYDEYEDFENYGNYYDYDEYEDYDYDEYEDYETEDTWFYEWRGHYSYDKPTLKQKIAWVLMDIRNYVIFKFKGYEDIPF